MRSNNYIILNKRQGEKIKRTLIFVEDIKRIEQYTEEEVMIFDYDGGFIIANDKFADIERKLSHLR